MALQNAAIPWLEELRKTQRGIVLPEHYIIRTRPDWDEQPNKDVYARKMAKVQRLAGLKMDQERTHIYRRSHASWARMRGISGEEIKLILGHSTMFADPSDGGATDQYVEAIRQLVAEREDLRSYITIPTPAELDSMLAGGDWIPPKGLQKEIDRAKRKAEREARRAEARTNRVPAR